MEYQCLQCGMFIKKKHKVQRPLCSNECRAEWNRIRRTKHCQVCGDAFVSTSKNAKFCSLKCVAKHNEIGNATCCQCGVDIGRPVKNNAKRSHCGMYCQQLSQLKSRACKLCPHCYGKPKVGCCEATKPERDPWELALRKAWKRRRRPDTRTPWKKKMDILASALRRRPKRKAERCKVDTDRCLTWEQALKIPTNRAKDPWLYKMNNKASNMRKRRRAREQRALS